MAESRERRRVKDENGAEKVPTLVVHWIRDAILDETFKPGDHLTETELGEMFEVSRSPVREALFALEKEGTVVMEPYKGAIVKPFSPEEVLDIAELRLALMTLAAKPAQRHLSPADLDLAYGLAKQITRCITARDYFRYNREFWDTILAKTQRPVLWGIFTGLEDRSTRYIPLLLRVLPEPGARPRPREMMIEHFREGKVDEALRTLRKIYMEYAHKTIEHLRTQESARDR
jgi:DNA-binding GntR family transcriptional regulator